MQTFPEHIKSIGIFQRNMFSRDRSSNYFKRVDAILIIDFCKGNYEGPE